MKLVEALTTLRQPAEPGTSPFPVALACGFTPLHLATFLAAHLRRREPGRAVTVESGLYGDLIGNVARIAADKAEAAAVVIEWADLDPRLGLRHPAGWQLASLDDINAVVASQANRLREAIVAASGRVPVAVAMPSLPLPHLSSFPTRQASAFECRLRAVVAELAVKLSEAANVRLVATAELDWISPAGDRRDVEGELRSGFPYTLTHASALAGGLAGLIRPPAPKKGLITDLDDTFWRGILGEVGVAGVTWDLDHFSQPHALYQATLRTLADAGVLVAVASKNEPALVQEAFHRDDLLIGPAQLFPIEAHWSPKSESVARILRAWNIGAGDVVFVDDSPMELAEVAAAHPGIETLRFPSDSQGVVDLLATLHDRFGKARVTADDRLRLESLRQGQAFREEMEHRDLDEFLAAADAELMIRFERSPADPRALELVNKTNQFNLNGRRHTEGAWSARLAGADGFVMCVAYRDKFGPLGTIAVMSGRVAARRAFVDVWVMSCRAFSRRVEHHSLAALFERLEVSEVVFDFESTPRNKPTQEFLASLVGVIDEGAPVSIGREAFLAGCPRLPHRVTLAEES